MSPFLSSCSLYTVSRASEHGLFPAQLLYLPAGVAQLGEDRVGVRPHPARGAVILPLVSAEVQRRQGIVTFSPPSYSSSSTYPFAAACSSRLTSQVQRMTSQETLFADSSSLHSPLLRVRNTRFILSTSPGSTPLSCTETMSSQRGSSRMSRCPAGGRTSRGRGCTRSRRCLST